MASARFTPEILVGLLEALDRSMGLMENTTVDAGRMREHLAGSLGIVVAEPLYVLLALHGVPQAHELARRLAQQARQQGRSVMEVAQEMPEVTAVLAGMTPEQRHVLDHPEAYLGRAREQVDAVCDEWEAQVGK
jgi:adenylosuccinate lyase